MQPLNMKLRGNVYEGSPNKIFFTELNSIMSYSIYESLRKKWRVQRHPIELTQSLLNQMKWDVFRHLAYLAPSDYHLIPSLKHDLCDRHFATEEDLQRTVPEFFAKQDAE